MEHVAEAANASDSLLFMHVKGVNTFISDSGVMRYHMVAEEWDILNGIDGKAPTWNFYKGLLMERYDENFHVDLYVQSDTAYLHEQFLWELRGRVTVRNIKGDVFRTEELFWDLNKHEMWSYKYMHIVTPERELEGTEFHSNEQMTQYYVNNSIGVFPFNEDENQNENQNENGDGNENKKTQDSVATIKQQKPYTKQMKFQPIPEKKLPQE
ncbi:MAG: LPS export ABC transporter periplasmic protein LptC [Bacteroidaceae bacterium]|nr:LPS export ABC transporter periplasmic protein LptC [Bacteroidaceae bacterium]